VFAGLEISKDASLDLTHAYGQPTLMQVLAPHILQHDDHATPLVIGNQGIHMPSIPQFVTHLHLSFIPYTS